MERSLLKRLPIELRSYIFELALTHSDWIDVYEVNGTFLYFHGDLPNPRALLKTCRAIRSQSEAIFYSSNIFVVHIYNLERWEICYKQVLSPLRRFMSLIRDKEIPTPHIVPHLGILDTRSFCFEMNDTTRLIKRSGQVVKSDWVIKFRFLYYEWEPDYLRQPPQPYKKRGEQKSVDSKLGGSTIMEDLNLVSRIIGTCDAIRFFDGIKALRAEGLPRIPYFRLEYLTDLSKLRFKLVECEYLPETTESTLHSNRGGLWTSLGQALNQALKIRHTSSRPPSTTTLVI